MVNRLMTDALSRIPRRLIHPSDSVTARDRQGPAGARGYGRQVEAKREREGICNAGLAGDARHPLHPADFESDETTERGARVQVGAACSFEAAADLGEAQRDEQRRAADRQKRNRAPRAHLSRHLRRQQEDRTADHLIHADCGEIPLPELASERELACGTPAHRIYLSHTAGLLRYSFDCASFFRGVTLSGSMRTIR